MIVEYRSWGTYSETDLRRNHRAPCDIVHWDRRHWNIVVRREILGVSALRLRKAIVDGEEVLGDCAGTGR